MTREANSMPTDAVKPVNTPLTLLLRSARDGRISEKVRDRAAGARPRASDDETLHRNQSAGRTNA